MPIVVEAPKMILKGFEKKKLEESRQYKPQLRSAKILIWLSEEILCHKESCVNQIDPSCCSYWNENIQFEQNFPTLREMFNSVRFLTGLTVVVL